MSIKGRDYLWFRKALERGGLATVRSTLVGLPPLTLDDALSVALLICEREPENAERAAVRWLRKLLERPGVTLAELREALDACVGLPVVTEQERTLSAPSHNSRPPHATEASRSLSRSLRRTSQASRSSRVNFHPNGSAISL